MQSLVKFVRRCKLRRDTTNEYFNSQTVLLHFISSQFPEAVKIGYLNFRASEFIPKSTRCSKCNRFGHVTKNCRGKDKCSKCSGEHSLQHCTSATTQCPNCNGEHTAGDRQCPKYRRESDVLKIKTTSKVSYAAACRLHRQLATAVRQQTTFTHRSREFPPLPVVPEGSPIGYRPFPTSKHGTVHEQTGSMECVDFTTNFLFANPLFFLAFLAQVITETISTKDRNQPVDIFKIITELLADAWVCQWMPNSLKQWPHDGSLYPPVELQVYI